MILYFNCRITGTILTTNSKVSPYFYPQVYPKQQCSQSPASQLDILVTTIESYSKMVFEHAIFNLEIDNSDEDIINKLHETIYKNFPKTKIILNFTRPSTLAQWKADIKKLRRTFDFNKPVLVVMNHDHPFVDCNSNCLEYCMKLVFSPNNSNFGKIFYYSHAPEVISWAINGRGKIRFKELSHGIFESSIVNGWIDSIGIMSLETLEHIWSKIIFNGEYIGRFDWFDVTFDKLNLRTYVFPREFIKHFDGYNHITGMRLISELRSSQKYPQNFPTHEDYGFLIEYYYQKWLDSFIIAVRDSVNLNHSFCTSSRDVFIKAIERTIDLFIIGYLNMDSMLGLIDPTLQISIENSLRNKIYFNGNSIFQVISTDIELSKDSRYMRLKARLTSILKYRGW